MKKYLYLAISLCMGFAVTSCGDDEEVVPQQQENNVQTVKLDFEDEVWERLIDIPQYNGPLLYGENSVSYSWTDNATGLSSALTNPGLNQWESFSGFSGGGIAISNYIDEDVEHNAVYTNQLAVPVSNGSKNFAVVYCDATIKFAEGVKRVIKSMDIAPTTYELGVVLNGDGYAQSLKESGNLTMTITADNGNKMDVDMARDGNILKTWKTYDLSVLGEVNNLTFTMNGSDFSDFGVKHPKYFAFDNVVVEVK